MLMTTLLETAILTFTIALVVQLSTTYSLESDFWHKGVSVLILFSTTCLLSYLVLAMEMKEGLLIML